MLLPRAVAGGDLGRGRRAHGGGRNPARSHRRVRLVAHRAPTRGLPVRLAGSGHRHPRLGRARGRARHPDRDAAALDARPPPRPRSGRRPGGRARVRFAPPLLLQSRRVPGRGPLHRRPVGRALRHEPARGRLADGQRVRLPPHRAQLLPERARRVPGMVRTAVRDGRGAQSRVGERVLVHGIRPLRPGRTARADRDRAQSGPRPRVPPLQLRSGAALQPRPVRRDPPPYRRPHRPQLHGTHGGVRPPRARSGSGRRGLGQLPPRLPDGSRRRDAGGKGAFPAPGASGLPGVSSRPLPQLRNGPLLGHGATARSRQLGPLEPRAAPGDAPALGVGGLRARRRDGLLLPLAPGSVRPGTDARGIASS